MLLSMKLLCFYFCILEKYYTKLTYEQEQKNINKPTQQKCIYKNEKTKHLIYKQKFSFFLTRSTHWPQNVSCYL